MSKRNKTEGQNLIRNKNVLIFFIFFALYVFICQMVFFKNPLNEMNTVLHEKKHRKKLLFNELYRLKITQNEKKMTSNIDLSANAFNITTLEVMPSKTTTQRVVTSQVITSQNISPHFTKKFQRSQEQLNTQIIKKTRYSLNETSLKFLLKFAADSKFDPKNPPRRTNLTLPTYSIIARMKASIKDHRMLEDVLNLTDKQILFGDLNPLDKKSVLETQSNNVISMSLYGSDPK